MVHRNSLNKTEQKHNHQNQMYSTEHKLQSDSFQQYLVLLFF